ncbi:unnamed protein product [Darwinula stevensoni]|uniref:Uncharacterized protein n=1 Tax=Darwinula stevensoni TaxID=69355 RepID=A0A7R9AB65_9CRUS|nr:unnamed protein product [Darwinula stevensoni]CAG0899127.1 unnamed protein product [Darwinula stevensoni]
MNNIPENKSARRDSRLLDEKDIRLLQVRRGREMSGIPPQAPPGGRSGLPAKQIAERDGGRRERLRVKRFRQAFTARRVGKAIVILACAALALRQAKRATKVFPYPQVTLQVEEYASFPTNTLYTMNEGAGTRAPAFTFCPKPSVKAAFAGDVDSVIAKGSTIAEEFRNVSVPLRDMVLEAPSPGMSFEGNSTVNGETTYHIWSDGGHWSERTFWGMNFNHPLGGFYFKCFTLFLNEDMLTGWLKTCRAYYFTFDFKAIRNSTKAQVGRIHSTRDKGLALHFCEYSMQMEVFVHDQREQFTTLGFFEPEQIVLLNDTLTSLWIRPEIVQKQSKKEDPCILDEDYSYTRGELREVERLSDVGVRQCMENCFWERMQADPNLPCLNPDLLPKEARVTKQGCRDAVSERHHLMTLVNTYTDASLNASVHARACGCPKRCNVTDYRIFADPTSVCRRDLADSVGDGKAILVFGFPSKRVPQFLEKEKVNLVDLLSNIGGIVGICLGASLITLFDIMEQVYFSLRHKLYQQRNEILPDGKH